MRRWWRAAPRCRPWSATFATLPSALRTEGAALVQLMRQANAEREAAREARREWASWDWTDRAAVFLKAAELLAGPWRQRLNAATILGQSKTVFQAEIDSACEVIDFWRWNAAFAQEI